MQPLQASCPQLRQENVIKSKNLILWGSKNDKLICFEILFFFPWSLPVDCSISATRTFLNILPASASSSYFYPIRPASLESLNKTESQKLKIFLSDLCVRCEMSSLQIIKNQNNIGTWARPARPSVSVTIIGNNLRNSHTETKTLLMSLWSQPESSGTNRNTSPPVHCIVYFSKRSLSSRKEFVTISPVWEFLTSSASAIRSWSMRGVKVNLDIHHPQTR